MQMNEKIRQIFAELRARLDDSKKIDQAKKPEIPSAKLSDKDKEFADVWKRYSTIKQAEFGVTLRNYRSKQ